MEIVFQAGKVAQGFAAAHPSQLQGRPGPLQGDLGIEHLPVRSPEHDMLQGAQNFEANLTNWDE